VEQTDRMPVLGDEQCAGSRPMRLASKAWVKQDITTVIKSYRIVEPQFPV
jgi:hypothetical protein